MHQARQRRLFSTICRLWLYLRLSGKLPLLIFSFSWGCKTTNEGGGCSESYHYLFSRFLGDAKPQRKGVDVLKCSEGGGCSEI